MVILFSIDESTRTSAYHLLGLIHLRLHTLVGSVVHSVIYVASVVLLDGTERLALHRIKDARVLVSTNRESGWVDVGRFRS